MIVGSLACLTFIGLITLLLWTSFSNIFGNPEEDNNDGQGGNNGEWNWDMNREKMVGVKIVLNLVVLVIACATLLVPLAPHRRSLTMARWHPVYLCLGTCCSFPFGIK